jgi:hypothetical protein
VDPLRIEPQILIDTVAGLELVVIRGLPEDRRVARLRKYFGVLVRAIPPPIAPQRHLVKDARARETLLIPLAFRERYDIGTMRRYEGGYPCTNGSRRSTTKNSVEARDKQGASSPEEVSDV